MVAIFTGAGTGFERGSGSVLGGSGLLGSATLGRSGEQVMVNAATGNLMIAQQDEFLVGRGPDVAVTRTYNSQGDFTDDNGDNWRMGNERAPRDLIGTLNTAGSSIKRMSGDGSLITYTWNGTVYSATDGAGAYDTLTKVGAVWRWVDGDSQMTEVYGGPNNQISQIIDPSGNRSTYTYDDNDRLFEITTSNGEKLAYRWVGNNVTEVVTKYKPDEPDATYAAQIYRIYDGALDRTPDANGFAHYLGLIRGGWTAERLGNTFYASTEYQNRTFGVIINNVTVAVPVAQLSDSDYVEFLYQSVLRRISDPGGKALYLASLTGGPVPRTRGQLLGIFVESGENISRSKPVDRDAPPLLSLIRTGYQYDSSNRLVAVAVELSPNDNRPWMNANYVTTYTYDGSSKRVASISQTDGSRLEISYDTQNRVSEIRQDIAANSEKRTTSITYGQYDQGFHFSDILDSDNKNVRLTYGLQNQLVQISSQPTHSGASPQQTNFDFSNDGRGDLVSVLDPAGNLTSYGYDSSGNVITVTDATGIRTQRTYDARNGLLTETTFGSDNSAADTPHTTRYVYSDDSDGHNLRFVIDPLGGVTEYIYVGSGLLQRTRKYTQQNYLVTGLSHSASPSLAAVENWLAGLTDKSSIELTLNTYDARWNITSSTNYGSATVLGTQTSAEGYSKTFFVYDYSGRLLHRTDAGRTQEHFLYDNMGRMVASYDTAGNRTAFRFDDAAGQTVVTLANGLTTTSTYNRAGDLVAYSDSATPEGTSYRYDELGRLRGSTDATGVGSYALYDSMGRKTADVSDDRSVIEYRYDLADRLTTTIRWGNVLNLTQFGRVTDPSDSTPISANRPAPSADDEWSWIVYDRDDRVIQSIDGDGATVSFEYDRSGQLVRQTAFANRLSEAQLAALRSAAPTAFVAPVAAPTRDIVSRNFYDGAGRLIGTLDGLNHVTESRYDSAGRMTQSIVYAAATTAANPATASFDVVRAGVVTNAVLDRHTRYVYDGQGQLRYVVDPRNHVVEYAYDFAGALTTTIA